MILIIGGGLAGMSTAYHLGDLPHLVLEAAEAPGGLCRSRRADGFLFDYTGHLLHLRDERVKGLVDELLPDTFRVIDRKAAIRTRGVELAFPFQANLHGLPAETVAECLLDFVQSGSRELEDDPAVSFEDWSLATFGRGISDAFMFPYNEKLFRRAPAAMTADWVSWAVPRPSLSQVVQGALGIENRGMGYNPTFRYPRQGGIGILPAALAERVPHMRTGARVTEVDVARRQVRLSDGETLAYDELVVTTPLPQFLGMVRGVDHAASLASRLDWSVVACLNLGVDRPEIAGGMHWLYFPDADTPFYRVGFPSNFSDSVAPRGSSSMYVEFGLRRDETPNASKLEGETIEALRSQGILGENDRVIAKDWIRIDPGYVIFDRARQEVMGQAVPEFARHDVHLIGRYGAWTYSYMERALLDGMELAHAIRSRTSVESTRS
jgi:protoporphyrinogen oxidase